MDAFDLQRMLLGEEPPLFFLEILARTLIIYVYMLVLLRWLGSRTIGQLSTVEFLLVIALGSAVGDVMFYPDVPLLHALLVVTIVVLINKALDLLMARSKRAQRVIDGTPEEAIRRGVICSTFADSTALSTSELFQQLRQNGIEHLGQVEHAYVETDGTLTIFKSVAIDRQGLPIVPPWEIEHPVEIAPDVAPEEALVCMQCGTIQAQPVPVTCPNCGHDRWTRPVSDRTSITPARHQSS